MKTSDFYYDLPKELIAQDPLEDRSSSRLLHLSMQDGSFEHRHFTDILDYLHKGDCLVINDTKVIPARLYGHKEETGAVIEILLLKRRENDIWECLVKPGKKARPGAKITFGDGILKGEIIDVVDEGNRLIQFHYDGIFEEILDQLGEMPLPPYITHKLKDKNRYQTVYAKNDGSAAAPTAGLHFTRELLKQVEDMGVKIAHVTLHVGLGTFRPVKVDDVEQHHMHSEFYMVEEDQAKLINDTKKAGKRVISVGTTSCRTLESATGEVRRVLNECRATIGVVGNQDYALVNIGKAGRTRHMGIRPTVRGSVMNPNDHPHGGGEGRQPIGRKSPMTPWGKVALGMKTRKHKNRTDDMIIRRRNG